MSEYTLKARTLPLIEQYDVIVAGGGPAGCTAAAAAAREGARTLLVEAAGALGGMGTLGLVPAWCPFSDKQKILYRGLAETVFNATKAGMPHVKPDALDWVAIDPELLKRVYDDLVTSAGAEVLFNTQLCAVETRGNGAVDAVIVSNKAGLSAYRAKVYVDATGDADLAAWAGAKFQKGDETGELQPATHCFMISNVDEYGYRFGPGLHGANPASPIHAIRKSGKYPLIPDTHMCNNLVGPGTVGFNAGHVWNVDNTDPSSVSRGLIHGRKMANAFRDALAEFFPTAFANGYLVSTGALLGIRETRRILGDYVLTADDFISLRSFADEICRNAYYIDIHHKQSEVGKKNADVRHGHRLQPGESHGLPYRCLTPKGLANVLVAGRSISTDRVVQGSTRVMPVCLAMGEAAGMAAAMAASGGADVHAVDTARLRTRLREVGAYLP
jgi:glycine/D-amino acid oxidase-like deaminating enzyme